VRYNTIYLERPERFRLGNVTWGTGKDYSMTHRWTIDYPEDLFLSRMFMIISGQQTILYFSLYEILALLREEPILPLLNAKYAGVNWYGHHLHELKTITQKETKILAEAVEQ